MDTYTVRSILARATKKVAEAIGPGKDYSLVQIAARVQQDTGLKVEIYQLSPNWGWMEINGVGVSICGTGWAEEKNEPTPLRHWRVL